jgi:uncharacterized protein (DUF58 family)
MVFDSEFLQKLEQLHYIARRLKRSLQRGEHRSIKKGTSQEFQDFRDYQVGDDMRYIDWNVYLRQNQLFVKLFAAEQELPVHLLIDTSASMAMFDKLDYAMKIAAALGFIALSRQDHIGIGAFRQNLVDSLPPGRRNRDQLFRYLSALQAGGETGLNDSLKAYTLLKRRPGLAVIISDFLDEGGYREGLLSLKYSGYEVLLIQVLHAEEISPIPGGNIQLVDTEDAGTMFLNLSRRILYAYHKEVDAYFKELEEFSMDYQMEYFRATTEIPFEDIILQYLREGQYLR